MTDTEKRNLERVKLWEETWNNDVERMVDELYATDCEVINMITAFVIHGREELRQVEHEIMKAAPDRRMHVYRTIASGDLVAIEADAFFGGRTLKSCVFLTFDRDGWITSDHSYGADPTATTVR